MDSLNIKLVLKAEGFEGALRRAAEGCGKFKWLICRSTRFRGQAVETGWPEGRHRQGWPERTFQSSWQAGWMAGARAGRRRLEEWAEGPVNDTDPADKLLRLATRLGLEADFLGWESTAELLRSEAGMIVLRRLARFAEDAAMEARIDRRPRSGAFEERMVHLCDQFLDLCDERPGTGMNELSAAMAEATTRRCLA